MVSGFLESKRFVIFILQKSIFLHYQEQMTADEHQFISRRYHLESKAYMKIMNIVLIIGFAFGTMMVLGENWHNVHEPNPELHTHNAPFFFLFILGFIALIAFATYFGIVYKLHLDSKNAIKTIAIENIIHKECIPERNLFMIHTQNAIKPIIEVNAEDYKRMNIGDEINIEYAAHSKEFFSYF
ncbi:MAG: hypothetical protein RLZZ118_1539 [Bacteroidota bacterium]